MKGKLNKLEVGTLKFFIKQFLIIFLSLVLLLTIVLLILYRKDNETERKILEEAQTHRVDLLEKKIIDGIRPVVTDLMILSALPDLKTFLKSNEPVNRNALTENFLLFSSIKKSYDQVRLLNEKGMEIVRVNFNDGNPSIVPQKDLQNKAQRYYFVETFRLKPGEVYISPFDLNIERGEIEQPLKPMIRFGTPVSDSQGRKRGIVFLSYFGEKLIHMLENIYSEGPGELMFINSDGFWLKGSKPHDEWGFMYKDRGDRNFGKVYHAAWQHISQHERGQFRDAKGLFTFTTVYPNLEVMRANTGSGKAFLPTTSPFRARLQWKIVARIPTELLSKSSNYLLSRYILIYAVIIVPLGLVSLLAAYARTNRKQAEKRLKKAALYIDAMGDVLIVFNMQMEVVSFNKAAKELLGYSQEEMAELTFEEIFPQKKHEKHYAEMKTAIVTETARYFETYILTKAGKEMPILLSVTVLKDEQHEPNGFIGVCRDITERKKAEDKYSTLFNSASITIFVAQDGMIKFANPKAAEILGRSLEELLSKPFTEFIHPEDQNMVLERHFQRTSGEEPPSSYSFRLVTGIGDVKWVELNVVAYFWESNPATLCYLTDISDRKQAEEALQTSEENYRNLVEHSIQGVYIHKDYKLMSANRAFAEMLGYENTEELIGLNILEFVAENERQRLMDYADGRIDGKDVPTRYTFEGLKKDGSTIWIDCMASVVRWNGEQALMGTIYDITEHKQIEEERKNLEIRLQQAEKMEAIGTLAGGVAHDLNNILSGLTGYPDLIKLTLFKMGLKDDTLIESVEAIKKSGLRASAVVNDLLTLARRGVSVKEVVNLNNIISEYLLSPEHEKLLLYHQGVKVGTNLKASLNFLGSSIHLSKTIMNLVSNAAEAMPGGGQLFILTENEYVDRPIRGYDLVEEGEYVVLTVSDSGIGIDPEDIKKIFEPFYTKKKLGRSGTGLGMSVVWGTVQDHNGYIDVQSISGEGTIITLYFPVTRIELEEHQPDLSIEDYMGNGQSILVVDDVEEQRKIASGILTKLGYSVTTVPSGEEAVEYLQNKPVDLMILDMIMDPGMDGLDTYKQILELHPGQKAIISSGFSETDRVKEAQELGARLYVRKPYTLEKIGLSVYEELNG